MILFWNDTLHVLDGLSIHHQEFKTVPTAKGCMSNRYCRLLASRYEMISISYPLASRQQYLFDIHPFAVCTVLNYWWWTERPYESCRMSFQSKIIWYIGASGWFYCRNILRCMALWTSYMLYTLYIGWLLSPATLPWQNQYVICTCHNLLFNYVWRQLWKISWCNSLQLESYKN